MSLRSEPITSVQESVIGNYTHNSAPQPCVIFTTVHTPDGYVVVSGWVKNNTCNDDYTGVDNTECNAGSIVLLIQGLGSQLNVPCPSRQRQTRTQQRLPPDHAHTLKPASSPLPCSQFVVDLLWVLCVFPFSLKTQVHLLQVLHRAAAAMLGSVLPELSMLCCDWTAPRCSVLQLAQRGVGGPGLQRCAVVVFWNRKPQFSDVLMPIYEVKIDF